MPFLRATNFTNGAKKGIRENYSHEMTLAALFTIHMNLCTMEFPLILSEANFMEVPKIRKNLRSLKKVHPAVLEEL